MKIMDLAISKNISIYLWLMPSSKLLIRSPVFTDPTKLQVEFNFFQISSICNSLIISNDLSKFFAEIFSMFSILSIIYFSVFRSHCAVRVSGSAFFPFPYFFLHNFGNDSADIRHIRQLFGSYSALKRYFTDLVSPCL